MSKRVWEIDYLRVFAILLMVIYHTVYDLSVYAGWSVVFDRGFWFWYGKLAMIFPFVSGISSGFSRQGSWRNGLKLLLLGMGITGVTFLAIPEEFVRFGALHFLGVAMILYPLLNLLSSWALGALAGGIFLLTGTIAKIEVGSGLLVPLGITYYGYNSADYFPLFPYLGVFILGMIAYKLYYYKKQSLFRFDLGNKYIAAISKRSLWIYILHQPLLLGAIFLYKKVGG